MPRNAWGAEYKAARFKPCPKCLYVHVKKCPRKYKRDRMSRATHMKRSALDRSLDLRFK